MSRDISPRLKLIVESDDELIDQFEYNWPQLDKYADSLSVADGVTPPDSDLYEGCLVSERTSGKLWMAVDNSPNTPKYKKSWIIYPWQVEAQGQGAMTSPDQVTRYFTDGLVLGSAADLDANKALVIPIHGIYEAWYRMQADNVNDSNRALWTMLKIDGATNSGTELINQFSAGTTIENLWVGNFEFSANQKVAYMAGMFGASSPCNCVTRVGISLIAPLD